MKALSLYQPYASLIAVGEKTWETRSRRTHHRGTIAIHATLRTPKEFIRLAETPIFTAAMKRHGLYASTLPVGAIVAVAEITDCITTTEWMRKHCRITGNPFKTFIPDPNKISREESEYCFGDYAPSRFAYKLENVRRLIAPVPCSGMQGMWNVPIEAFNAVNAQL